MEWAGQVTVGRASYKSVLVALADRHHASNDSCIMSMEEIISFTELNAKTIKPALAWLQEAGFITEEKPLGHAPNYRLHLEVTSSKIGRPSKAGNADNLEPGPSPKKPDTSSKIGKGGGSSKISTDPFQNFHGPLPNLEDKRVNGFKRELYPPTPHAEIADRILGYLNQLAGRKFRLTDSNRKGITARLSEDFTEQDCVRVLDDRWARWRGTDMEQHFNPETLFRPKNFEKYLNAVGTPHEAPQRADPRPQGPAGRRLTPAERTAAKREALRRDAAAGAPHVGTVAADE